jgi:LemA protein
MSADDVVALGALAILAFWVLGAYNRLVRLRQAIATAFALVDVQLRQRQTLLGLLIEAATAGLADAPEALAAVEAARRQARVAADHAAQSAVSAGRLASLALAEQVLHTALSRLITLVKARPELRADAGLRQVTKDLSAAQHRLTAARHGFNATVLDYNRSRRQFPTRLVARLFGFRRAGEL